MRTFLRAHWKAIVAILLLIVLAMATVSPSAAMPDPSLAARLRTHVSAIGAGERNTAMPQAPEQAAAYIQDVLGSEGYRIRRQADQAGGHTVRSIEVSVANVAAGAQPARIFIIGARYDSTPGAPGANDDGSGTAAVLELARLLKSMRPSQGTEVRFVFFVNREPPWLQGEDMGLEQRYPETGNFIAFVGTLASSRLAQEALSAFQARSDFPARGLAAPAYVQGVTLSDRSAYDRFGYPAIMITDTAFMRYPYYHTAEDTPDKPDYGSMARVVEGLARTITALAAGARA